MKVSPARLGDRRSGHAVLNIVIILGLLSLAIRIAWPIAVASWELSVARDLVATVRVIQAEVEEAAQADPSPEALAVALRGAPLGTVPEQFAAALGEGATFETPDYRMGWSWWSYGEALGERIEGPGVGTLTVEIRNAGIRDAFQRLTQESVWYVVGETTTFLIPVADTAS